MTGALKKYFDIAFFLKLFLHDFRTISFYLILTFSEPAYEVYYLHVIVLHQYSGFTLDGSTSKLQKNIGVIQCRNLSFMPWLKANI